MKYIFISLAVLTLGFLLPACKHSKYAADKLPGKQIRWGNGGGIVGKEKSHILLENGQIFSRDIMGSTVEATKTREKKAKTIFKQIDMLGLARMVENKPGNTYSFLEFQDGDMVSRVVWGDKNSPDLKSVQALFEELNGLLKR